MEQQWIDYVTASFGSIEEFNKLPYSMRIVEWEAFINEEE